MFQIIRIVFWVFIISQVVLLLAHQKIRFQVTQKGLAWSLGLKIGLIIAYAIYVNVCFYAEEAYFLRFAFWGNLFFRSLAYIFEILLVVLVWFAFLQHTVQKNKVYYMTGLSARRAQDGEYRIYGTIREGKHNFDVVASVTDQRYMELAASGYFDKAGAHKSLQVFCSGFVTDDNEHSAGLVVVIPPRLVMPKQNA